MRWATLATLIRCGFRGSRGVNRVTWAAEMTMAQANSVQREPSMEEILASIRRIIEDSDGGARHRGTSRGGRPGPSAKLAESTPFAAELGADIDRPPDRSSTRPAVRPGPARCASWPGRSGWRGAGAGRSRGGVRRKRRAERKPMTLADIQQQIWPGTRRRRRCGGAAPCP